MTERQPELPELTIAQDAALQDLCERYGVGYSPSDYTTRFDLPEGYVAGYIGGYEIQKTHPTLYVGCDPDGRISS